MLLCDVHFCYMTEAQKGMSTRMTEAYKEAKDGNMTLKQSVHCVANKFLNAVESPVVEGCYDILPLSITQ